ncbi:MAG TPA: DNA repair protein RecO [Patescibacteria group bacterium]|nr:DNA repair protein RecO [Patescibacteria group bacterium]
MRQSISDSAIVLSRLDYAEKDRILTVLTSQHGKLRAIAKSVRSAKSKLAGGIELFAENELVLVQGRGELYTVTSSRMKHYFGNIAKNSEASMYVYECLKFINKVTPDGAGGEYYDSLAKLLKALDEAEVPFEQIKIWYGLKVLESLGALPNFITDSDNKRLVESGSFQYDFDKHCFFEQKDGPFDADHIKILRFLLRIPQPLEIKNIQKEVIDSTENLVRLILLNQSA